MKKLVAIHLLVCFSLTVSAAVEIYITGAGIDEDSLTGSFSYMIGVGPSGAEPNPITPLNQEVAQVLEKAAKEMSSSVEICMTGSDLKVGDGSIQYMVYKAVESNL